MARTVSERYFHVNDDLFHLLLPYPQHDRTFSAFDVLATVRSELRRVGDDWVLFEPGSFLDERRQIWYFVNHLLPYSGAWRSDVWEDKFVNPCAEGASQWATLEDARDERVKEEREQVVIESAMMGRDAKEVARRFGVTNRAVYNYCNREVGTTYADLCQQYRQKRVRTWKTAIEWGEDPDAIADVFDRPNGEAVKRAIRRYAPDYEPPNI